MTIQCSGYVEKMETGSTGKIRLYIILSMDRAGGTLVIEATKEELGGMYMPGTGIELLVKPVRPNG